MEMELQAYLVQFFPQCFNEMGNKKKKKWEIKRRRNVRKLSQLHAFSFFKRKFEKFITTAKAMCLRIKVALFNFFLIFFITKIKITLTGEVWK